MRATASLVSKPPERVLVAPLGGDMVAYRLEESAMLEVATSLISQR